jgi:hypothetical protein
MYINAQQNIFNYDNAIDLKYSPPILVYFEKLDKHLNQSSKSEDNNFLLET